MEKHGKRSRVAGVAKSSDLDELKQRVLPLGFQLTIKTKVELFVLFKSLRKTCFVPVKTLKTMVFGRLGLPLLIKWFSGCFPLGVRTFKVVF